MADQGLGQFLQDITTYLILLIIIATSGSLQFGYHLVRPLPEASRSNLLPDQRCQTKKLLQKSNQFPYSF